MSRSDTHFLKCLKSLILLSVFFCALTAQANITTTVNQLVENQRRILVLREAASKEERGEARRAGQYLFFENQRLSKNLLTELTLDTANIPLRYRELTASLDNPTFLDEDRFALRGRLENLLPKLPAAERADAQKRLDRLNELGKDFAKEYEQSLQHIPLPRDRQVSNRWSAYIAKLTKRLSTAQILADLDDELIGATPADDHDLVSIAAKARVLEWNGEELPDRTILLTFDDGPHPVHTAAILDVLKSNNVRAVFFQIGRNLSEGNHGQNQARQINQIEQRIITEGHAVGNHSFSHTLLTRLPDKSIGREIAETQLLLEMAIPNRASRTSGFRPPFGIRDDKVLVEVDRQQLRSIVWNIDSEDWADPVPMSIAHRVVQEAEKAGRGIVLMHDIHARSVEALPIVIDELRKRGFRFARWNGKKLVIDQASYDYCFIP